MKILSPKIAGVFILLVILLDISCTKTIDKVHKDSEVPRRQGFFEFYPDSDIYIFKSDLILSRDAELINSKDFKIVLPKGIKYSKRINTTDFLFRYNTGESIVVNIDLNDKPTLDKTYYLEGEMLNNFLDSVQSSVSFFQPKELAVKSNRINLYLKRKWATIVLLNISHGKDSLFLNSANSLIFFDDNGK